MTQTTVAVRLDNGERLEGVLTKPQGDRIQVAFGEGFRRIRCELQRSDDGKTFTGNLKGRNITWHEASAVS